MIRCISDSFPTEFFLVSMIYSFVKPSDFINSVPENIHPTVDMPKFRLENPSLQISERILKLY